MVHINMLKSKMIERGVNSEKLAEALDVNLQTYYRRLKNDGANLRISDVQKITKVLELNAEEFNAIFYG